MGITEQEVRAYLHKIGVELEARRRKIDQVEELRAVAESCTVRTDKESIQSSGSGDKMANIVGRMIDLLREIDELDEKIHDRVCLVVKASRGLRDERQKRYLNLRYICCNSFYDTVMMMNLSDSTARRIDRKTISELTRVINHDHNHYHYKI